MLGGLVGLRGTALVREGRSASRSEHYVCLPTSHGCVKRVQSSSSAAAVMCRSAARQGSLEEEQKPLAQSSSSSSSRLMWALLKNPVAFFGGCFVGIMELDVTQDPLKGWIQERVEDMREGR
ncbi:hypothetical protein PSENEW3n2_00002136 [Picochlorum sp. SENEW3]|nr:hypothetical protein PSENEW3n2_00002136 [Picochlorum sp. SENEW3]WPT14906.1 hypothetical protein PSENEW3_00002136 [Picochlorum sp. SENEW3]